MVFWVNFNPQSKRKITDFIRFFVSRRIPKGTPREDRGKTEGRFG